MNRRVVNNCSRIRNLEKVKSESIVKFIVVSKRWIDLQSWALHLTFDSDLISNSTIKRKEISFIPWRKVNGMMTLQAFDSSFKDSIREKSLWGNLNEWNLLGKTAKDDGWQVDSCPHPPSSLFFYRRCSSLSTLPCITHPFIPRPSRFCSWNQMILQFR